MRHYEVHETFDGRWKLVDIHAGEESYPFREVGQAGAIASLRHFLEETPIPWMIARYKARSKDGEKAIVRLASR